MTYPLPMRVSPSGPYIGTPNALPTNGGSVAGRVWRNQGVNASAQIALNTTAYQTILEVNTPGIIGGNFTYDVEFYTTVLTQTTAPVQDLKVQAWNGASWDDVDNRLQTCEKGDHMACGLVNYTPVVGKTITKFRLAGKMNTTASTDACTLAADNKAVGRVFEYLSPSLP